MAKTIILITGANQGLGFEVAKRLSTAEQNLHLILAGRSIQKVAAAVESLEAIKGPTNTLQALELDVTIDASITSAIQQLSASHSHLDVLLNNAGIAHAKQPTLRAEYAAVFDTNVFGAAVLTDACIPLLSKSANPRIIFMSSGLGSISAALDPTFLYYGIDAPAYTVSKAAMNMLTAHYAVKYGKQGFQVNACDPGFRKTQLNDHAAMAGDAADGAVNACRLIMLSNAAGEAVNGTFSDVNGLLQW